MRAETTKNRCERVVPYSAAAGELLSGYLTGAGDHEVYEPQPGRKSLVARIEGSDPDAPSLMLMGHTDVVPVNAEGWTRDPFSGQLVDGFIVAITALGELLATHAPHPAADRNELPDGPVEIPPPDVAIDVTGLDGMCSSNHRDAIQDHCAREQ